MIKSPRDKVHAIAYQAKKSGRLIAPEQCEGCGRTAPLVMHHEDYSRPLDVAWVCRPCHGEIHRPGRQELHRKVVPVPPAMAEAVKDYRFQHRLESDVDAYRILIQKGLDAADREEREGLKAERDK